MSFYNDIAAIAHELLTEFGQEGTLGSVAADEYNPATGSAAVTSTPHAVTLALFAFPQRLIDGTMVLAGDQRAIVSAVGLAATPKPADTLTDAAGAKYRVVEAKPIAPAGTVALWILQARK